MNPTNWIVRVLLGAALVSLTVLLLDPPSTVLPAPTEAREANLPTLEPLALLAAEGRPAEALGQLAALVRQHPALADRGGPLDALPILRDLVLRDWKMAVEHASDRATSLKDARFLQRRLAGGCS